MRAREGCEGRDVRRGFMGCVCFLVPFLPRPCRGACPIFRGDPVVFATLDHRLISGCPSGTFGVRKPPPTTARPLFRVGWEGAGDGLNAQFSYVRQAMWSQTSVVCAADWVDDDGRATAGFQTLRVLASHWGIGRWS